MKLKNIFLSLVITLLLSSCTHQKIAVNRIDDTELSCAEIKDEITRTENMRNEINSKTGMSGRNVGMALLFWPGIVVNEINGSDAERLATQRVSVLTSLYRRKKCSTKLRHVNFQEAQ